MKFEKRWELVTRNTEEIITPKELEELLRKKKKFNFYLGIAPTGPFHLGHLINLVKCMDIAKAGGDCTLLIADFHAYLDDMKTPWELMKIRSDYWEMCIKSIWDKALPVEIVRGSSYQRKPEYMEKVLKAIALVTVTRAKRAAREITRMETPKVSELVYPVMMDMDVIALNADLEVGGIDQRGAFMLGREVLPELGYTPEVDVCMPLIPGLREPGTKMSSSIPGSCITVHDDPEDIKNKIEMAYCPAGDTKDNPITSICKFILFPRCGKLRVKREKKYGGDITFESYKGLKEAFIEERLHPADLKRAVADKLIEMLEPVRKKVKSRPEVLRKFKKSLD
ncbi:MAG: tyrosine--tRNA ligase [candidate division WOR-3 bacterium]|nr:tyrosine--tRNA ligase [candidate division WOR-3 bacterium]